MKAFQISGDENRIYFQNLLRRPGEEELQEVIKILTTSGGRLGKKNEVADVDMYMGSLNGTEFRLLYTGEEAIICTDSKESAGEILKIFE